MAVFSIVLGLLNPRPKGSSAFWQVLFLMLREVESHPLTPEKPDAGIGLVVNDSTMQHVGNS